MIALDTNLLVYAHRASVPEHRAARRAIEAAAGDSRGWGITLPSIAEFWSIVTHPSSAGGPSTPQQAQAFLGALTREAGSRVWLAPEGSPERLLHLAAALRVQGPRIFDLQIALTAFENGATEIWTHDRGFLALPGLLVRDPL
jgi:toxin-antitoxin system PIN domain toxin